MFALDTTSRTLLATAAFASFGAAFVTTPLVAPSEAGMLVGAAPSVVTLPRPTPFADVIPRRNPFAGDDAPARPNTAVAQTQAVQTATSSLPQIPAMPQIPAALRVLPPNAGAGADLFPLPAGARTDAVVTAVITGPHPFALVDEAGTTRVLTIGDRIGGNAIAAIAVDGVRLSNGTRLPVAPASQPVAPLPPPLRAATPAQPPAHSVAPPPAFPSPLPAITARSITGGP
jgi:hypothetical protein